MPFSRCPRPTGVRAASTITTSRPCSLVSMQGILAYDRSEVIRGGSRLGAAGPLRRVDSADSAQRLRADTDLSEGVRHARAPRDAATEDDRHALTARRRAPARNTTVRVAGDPRVVDSPGLRPH